MCQDTDGHGDSGVHSKLFTRRMDMSVEYSTHNEGRGSEESGEEQGVEMDPVATAGTTTRLKQRRREGGQALPRPDETVRGVEE